MVRRAGAGERFPAGVRAGTGRIEAGYAPFWRYLETGLYGQQLEHLYGDFPQEQVFVLRYRQLIDNTASILDEISAFLGVRTGLVSTIPRSNVSNWVPDTPINTILRKAVRAGAVAGRTCRRRCGGRRNDHCWPPCTRVAVGGRRCRSSSARACCRTSRRTTPYWAGSTGIDYSDWLNEKGRGAFTERQ